MSVERIKTVLHRCLLTALSTALFSVAMPVMADQACVDYTDDGFLRVAMTEATAQQIAVGHKAIANLVAAAKTNAVNDQIQKQYASKDGSAAEVALRLSKSRSLVDALSKIERWDIKSAYRWGNYLVFWTNYVHQGQQSLLLDAFYCETMTSCRHSTMFDKSAAKVDLVSRFMSYVRTGQKQSSCANLTADFVITAPGNQQDPLQVYVKKQQSQFIDSQPDAIRYLKQNLVAPNLACLTKIAEFDVDQHQAIAMQQKYQQIISDCATNLTEGSGIPAVNLSGKPERFYQVPAAFIADLQQLKNATVIGKFQDKGLTVFLLQTVLSSKQRRLIMLPVSQQGKYLIDWAYYGDGAAELLLEQDFALHVLHKKRANKT